MPDYFDDLKNDLDITFDDSDLNKKLINICGRAESYLSKKAGITLTFSKKMEDKSLLQLLFDCIRYIRDNALDEFAQNYADELFCLRANSQAYGETDEK